jgi:putative hemolysin
VGTYLTGESPFLSFAEYWNGSKWTVQSTPNASGTDTYLDGVSSPASGTCTAVGYTAANDTLVENLKAGTWTVTAGPSPGKGGSLAGVWCAATTACSAVGQYTTSGGNGRTLAERWNGQAWAVQPAAVSSAGAYQVNELTGVACVAASWCMASGSNQTYYTTATGALSAVTERYAPGG